MDKKNLPNCPKKCSEIFLLIDPKVKRQVHKFILLLFVMLQLLLIVKLLLIVRFWDRIR